MASNVGSVATITGNPQNMMIGSFSAIPYRQFTAALAPVAAVGLLLIIATLRLLYRREFSRAEPVDVEHSPVRVNRALLWKSIAASAGMIVFFFAGWPVPKVALVAGALLLVTRRVKPEKVYLHIDWQLLVLFVGLFIVVAGVDQVMLSQDLASLAERFHLERAAVLSTLATLLSNLVSNVPAVLLFKPFIARLADPARGWLTLAMSATLAGNLTVLGSVANLIVIQRARPEVKIGFWEYCRAGAPLTLATIAFGVWWLA